MLSSLPRDAQGRVTFAQADALPSSPVDQAGFRCSELLIGLQPSIVWDQQSAMTSKWAELPSEILSYILEHLSSKDHGAALQPTVGAHGCQIFCR
ncbi:hypothetical protein WJX73_000952 [Symbiochloris irregularis]|uniref:F-box domain-containing protein n=1 Tax=Symbiochloris irregularis TaxID=706552 RepID=A0AAW1NZS5_9CHLO